MFSVAYVFCRPEGMSIEAFEEHYRTTHAELAKKLPGLLRYTQNPVRKDAPVLWHAADAAAFDAISIYTFASDEAAQAAFDSEENKALQADSHFFIDFSRMISLPVSPRRVL